MYIEDLTWEGTIQGPHRIPEAKVRGLIVGTTRNWEIDVKY